MKRPAYELTVNDQPLGDALRRNLISLTVTDNRSGEADEIQIVVADSDGTLELPRRGVTLKCALGWHGSPTELHPMGTFTVDEVEWSGPPDQITIKGRSADFKGPIKAGRRQSYHRQTLGQIASTIAGRHKLQPNIAPSLAGISVPHIDQTDESDLNLLARLVRQNGGEFSIKSGRLLIFVASEGTATSGKGLSTLTITRRNGDQFRYSEADRDSDYTGVSASYQEKGKARRAKVTAGQPEPKGGGNDPARKTKVLKGTYASKQDAENAAQAQMNRVKKRKASLSFSTPYGIPEVSTESPVQIQGLKQQIDALRWIVIKATHQYSSSGLTTDLDLEASL